MQEEEYDKQAVEQLELDIAITLKNKQIRDGLLQFATDKGIRELGKERAMVKPVVLPEEALEMAIRKSADIKEQLKEARSDQMDIEDEVNNHLEFVKICGYEKMAEIKMQRAATLKYSSPVAGGDGS